MPLSADRKENGSHRSLRLKSESSFHDFLEVIYSTDQIRVSCESACHDFRYGNCLEDRCIEFLLNSLSDKIDEHRFIGDAAADDDSVRIEDCLQVVDMMCQIPADDGYVVQ